MIKKYLPWILFLATAVLLYWVKTNQRGANGNNNAATETAEGFNRNGQKLEYSKHARCRMGCRQIDESEVHDILKNGLINYNRIEEDERGKTIPLEGTTADGQHVRIVFAPKEHKTIVVTVIDLDKEWQCDCS